MQDNDSETDLDRATRPQIRSSKNCSGRLPYHACPGSLVRAGPRFPESALMQKHFPGYLRKYSESFDMILLDTPPMLMIPDARLLGKMAQRCRSSGESRKHHPRRRGSRVHSFEGRRNRYSRHDHERLEPQGIAAAVTTAITTATTRPIRKAHTALESAGTHRTEIAGPAMLKLSPNNLLSETTHDQFLKNARR